MTGTWGRGIEYFFIFLTYQTTTIVIFYYGARIVSFLCNKDLYRKITNASYHAAITSYAMFIFVLMAIVLFPYSVLTTSLSTVIEDLKARGGFWGMMLRHFFIHFLIPIVVFYDFLRTKHDKKDIEAMNKKTISCWFIYMIGYLIFAIVLGATTGMYAYPIVNFNIWGWWMFAFYPPLTLIYWGLAVFLYYSKKRSIKKISIILTKP